MNSAPNGSLFGRERSPNDFELPDMSALRRAEEACALTGVAQQEAMVTAIGAWVASSLAAERTAINQQLVKHHQRLLTRLTGDLHNVFAEGVQGSPLNWQVDSRSVSREQTAASVEAIQLIPKAG